MSARKTPTSAIAPPAPISGTLSAEEQVFVTAAQQHCLARGGKLTPLRVDVLLHVRKHPGGIKAYELLSSLQAVKPGLAPMSVYRALDFLVDTGLVHKVDVTSSFILCEHGQHHHDHGLPVMLICKQCGKASEYAEPTSGTLHAALDHLRDRNGFHATGLEIKGLCQQCSTAEAETDGPDPKA